MLARARVIRRPWCDPPGLVANHARAGYDFHMRPTSHARPGRIRRLAAALVACALAGAAHACTSPTGEGSIATLKIAVPVPVLRPGFTMQAEALATDGAGQPVIDRPVRWRSLTPATLEVDAQGLLLARAPGAGIVRASVGDVSTELTLQLVNPPIAQLRLDADTLRMVLPGGQRPLLPTAVDSGGVGIVGAPITWESSAPRIASVTTTGIVTAVAVGRAVITVRGDGLVASSLVLVEAPPSATSPVIGGVAPAVAVPGQQLVVNGSGFGSTPAANTVFIDGVPIPVSAASPTQLALALPPAAAFPCAAARTVALQVNTGGGIGVAPVGLVVATARTLAVGQSLVLTSATDARCNELAPAAGRYLVTIPNAARSLGSGAIAVSVRGEATAAPTVLRDARHDEQAMVAARNAAAVRLAVDAAAARLAQPVTARTPAARRERQRMAAHVALLDANRRIAATGVLRPVAPRGAALVAPTVGSIVPVRIPAIGAPTLCSEFTPIQARIVHVGERIAVLEDTATVVDGRATLAGQLDAQYAAIGAELDTRGWAAVQQFGNPLVMDGRLDDNGRVLVVFSPRVNQRAAGTVLAAVVNCDFFPRAQFAASNTGEYLYAQVPTSAAEGMGAGTVARWRHEMRATLVHELKHVTAYAERIVRGQPLEESWLEEATARHAEELYARAAYGVARYADAGFGATLACELRANDPAYPACADAPRAMRPHLEALWSFLDAPTALSPLGPSAPGDFTFYGSGWALTRWLLDAETANESAVLAALTTSAQSGVANLEARTGRAWDELLPEWTLAMVSDGRPGLVTSSRRVRFPSWELRGLFAGLCDATGSCDAPGTTAPYARAWPVRPLQLEAGAFSAEFPSVAPGGFAVLELVVTGATARQVIELRGYRGASLPTGVRLGILRIE